MKKNYFKAMLALIFFATSFGYSQVDVTFRVDMAGQTVSTDGVHVAGTINGWTTDANQLMQEGTTSIYSTTIQVNTGWQRFKFLNGNAWGTEESASYPCAPTNGDRFMYINDSGAAVVLEALPFEGCNSAGTGFEITFNVDMSSEGNIAPGNVHLAGWLTDWNPGVLTLPDVNGDIHSGTLRMPTPADYAIEFEYKYLSASGWGNEEVPGPDDTCDEVTGQNRLVTVNNTGENLYDIFNGCTYNLSLDSFNENEFKFVYNKNLRSLEIIMDTSNELSEIQVFDINGRLIDSYKNIDLISQKTLDFSSADNGMYFIRLQSGHKQKAKKVLVY